MTASAEIIRIDKDFSYSFDAGRVTLSKRGQVIAENHQQAAKAIIDAASELEAHRDDHFRINTVLGVRAANIGTAFPSSVEIENGKYTFACDQAGLLNAVNHRLLRNSEAWLDVDELQLPEFWFALATALHNARRQTEALKVSIAGRDFKLDFELESDQF